MGDNGAMKTAVIDAVAAVTDSEIFRINCNTINNDQHWGYYEDQDGNKKWVSGLIAPLFERNSSKRKLIVFNDSGAHK